MALAGTTPGRHGTRAAAGLLLGLALWSLPAPASAQSAPHRPVRAGLTSTALPYAAELDAYLRTRPGVTTVAVRALGDPTVRTYAPAVRNVTASIVKVDVLATVLRRAQDQRRALAGWERDRLTAMITQSDNAATTALWNDLGGGPAVARFNALVPLRSTVMGSGGYWGLTTTTAADQVALLDRFAVPNDVLSDASRAYGLGLMHAVRADQAWGVTAGPPAGTVAVKNGWLPRTDGWHVNSDGVVTAGPTSYTVSVLTASSTASMADQVATLEGVSRIVWRGQVTAPVGAIRVRYDAVGGPDGYLGRPRTGEIALPTRPGRYQLFEGGSVYWSPGTGAWDVHGAVRDRWAALGYELGLLRLPVSGELPLRGGVLSRFEGGVVAWSPGSGAHEVHGAVLAGWARSGYETGPLGFPTTDEARTPAGTGAVSQFTGGTMSWSPATGAHWVRGAIRQAWAQRGAEGGVLGYPTTDEIPTPTRVGAVSAFAGGSVAWSPTTGAHAVLGPLRAAWLAGGAEQGCLGFPTGEEHAATTGGTTTRTSDFEHGTVTWTAATGARTTCS